MRRIAEGTAVALGALVVGGGIGWLAARRSAGQKTEASRQRGSLELSTAMTSGFTVHSSVGRGVGKQAGPAIERTTRSRASGRRRPSDGDKEAAKAKGARTTRARPRTVSRKAARTPLN